jgi:ferritin-like metal-binding protein YciE
MDLYSAEEQIIEALPGMIDKAKNPELKKALREHLRITEEQKNRLDKIKQSFGEGEAEGEEGGEKKGFFSRLFGGGGEKCKGMEGLITEGEKIMKADITDEALDAAIIASAQKIEHYEICGYGTARAFARELQLTEVERLLTQTLNEEYTSDDMLTELAVGKLNLKAEHADGMVDNKSRSGRTNRLSSSNSSNGSSSKGGNNSGRNLPSKRASKSSASKGTKSSGNGISKSGGSSNRNALKANSSKGSSKSGSSKGNSKNSSPSKGSNKSGSSKGNSKSGGSSSKGNSKSSTKSSRTGGSKGSKSSSKSSSKGNSRRR